MQDDWLSALVDDLMEDEDGSLVPGPEFALRTHRWLHEFGSQNPQNALLGIAGIVHALYARQGKEAGNVLANAAKAWIRANDLPSEWWQMALSTTSDEALPPTPEFPTSADAIRQKQVARVTGMVAPRSEAQQPHAEGQTIRAGPLAQLHLAASKRNR
ncbi:MAG: hypothetical protein A2289_07780 [Deltaproteobacteria bacterium RIFOXYA12_FULL_58_15]|nr:MAG: hypothetical protein A2289_07780 [Deltaproteobacteria bacterium RIFOXYA12_FULL_58_15]